MSTPVRRITTGGRIRLTAVLAVLVLVAGGAAAARLAGAGRIGWLAGDAGRSPDAGATGAPVRDVRCSGGGDACEPDLFAVAAGYLRRLPGDAGLIVRDRRTGRVLRAGSTDQVTWTASTIKLAIATDLLERERDGGIRLTGADRSRVADMLRASSNAATDALWSAYGADTMIERFRTRYGMTGLVRVPGNQPAWHGYACSTEDLLNLVSYVLDRLDAPDRAYLVGALRAVAGNQRWGVWAAGSGMAPGNKDGWAEKPDPGGSHWVVRSVGFAGPAERYAVAASISLPPGATVATGVQAVSDLVALAFGAPVPARVSAP